MAVIGGGDTAMDCVRTALREKARSVTCYYRRDEANMPGSKKEFINAREEGVDFEFCSSPKEIITDEENRVTGLKMVKTELKEPDSSGRQKVQEVPHSDFSIDADIVIFALGFEPVKYKFLEKNGIKLNQWGEIIVDDNYQTTREGIYAEATALEVQI